MELKKLQYTAIEASLKAGEEIMNVYESDFAVEKKEDRTPLTLADRNSHHIISEILSQTDIPVLSEEGKDIPFSERKNWKRLWIVDPLDGTKEFVKRNGEFTVNIALIQNQKPVLGVIYAPVTKTLYYGAQDMGSFKLMAGELSAIDFSRSYRLPLFHTKKFTIVASRSHMNPETHAYIEELKKQHGDIEIISGGSSIKICLVAEGSADIYPRFGTTMEWDTASGQAIAECSGKNLIDLTTGVPMVYNREDLKNNSFIVR